MVKKQSEVNRILKKLIEILESKNVRVSQLILYGSYAWGNPNTYSDIDIAVISPSFRDKSILRRQELLGEAIFSLGGEPIEALGYTPEECRHFNRFSFVSEILSTGKTVYKKH